MFAFQTLRVMNETSCATQTWGRPFGGYNSPPSWTMSQWQGWWQWQQEQWRRKPQIRILEIIIYDLTAKIKKEVLLSRLWLVWQVEADVQVVVAILSKDHQDDQTSLYTSLAWERPAGRSDQDLRSESCPGLPGPSTPPASILTNFAQRIIGYIETCCPRTVLKEKTFIWSGVTAITPSLITDLYISKQFVAGVLVSMKET